MKARKDKRGGARSTTHYKDKEMSKLKETVAAQKKLLAINEAQDKTLKMEAAPRSKDNV